MRNWIRSVTLRKERSSRPYSISLKRERTVRQKRTQQQASKPLIENLKQKSLRSSANSSKMTRKITFRTSRTKRSIKRPGWTGL